MAATDAQYVDIRLRITVDPAEVKAGEDVAVAAVRILRSGEVEATEITDVYLLPR